METVMLFYRSKTRTPLGELPSHLYILLASHP
jgi:hypothetical protein